jgi:predicted nucleic acid-binding protein
MSTAGRGVVDTNVVVLLREVQAESLPEVPVISSITLAELAVGPLVAADPVQRARRQEHLRFAESSFPVLPFDEAAAHAFGVVAAALRVAGRKVSARGFDALIAATALAHELPLFTTNPGDFAEIDGLTVVPVVTGGER